MSAAAWQSQGFSLPRRPIAGAGYVLPPHDGFIVFGATSQRGDAATDLRAGDHAANVAQLGRLLGNVVVDGAPACGRVAVRWSAGGRLPLVGPVPDADVESAADAMSVKLLESMSLPEASMRTALQRPVPPSEWG